MSLKITGKNFQAWDHFELEAEGLTVVIGPSNEGKSNIFRATKGMIRNELGAHFVKIGTDGLKLTLEFDGHTVTATRTKSGSTTYVIDGDSKYAKLNRAIPEPVLALGLNEIKLGDITLDPVFARQGAPQFLIDEQPMALNTVLGAFASTEKLEGGKREANRRVGEKNSEARVLAEEARVQEALQAKLAELAEKAQEIQEHVGKIQPVIRAQEKLIAELGILITHTVERDRLQGLLVRLTVPTTAEAENGELVVTSLVQAITARQRHAQIDAVVAKLITPDLNKAERYVQGVEELKRLLVSQRSLVTNQKWFSQVDAVITIWTSIVADYQRHKAIAEAMERLRKRETSSAQFYATKLETIFVAVANGLDPVEKQELTLVTTNNALAHHLLHAKAHQSHAEAEVALAELRADERNLREQIELLEHSVTCPKCGEAFIPIPGNGTTQEAHTHD